MVGCAVLGATLLADHARADGQERPALPALLEGDPELVATVGDELGRRGVATMATSEDQAIRVTLARQPDGIVLALHDPQGRAAERRVATAETAATLIESWARPGLAEPLLDRQPPPPPPAIVTAPVLPAEPAARRWTPVFRFGADNGDHRLWLGAGVGACGRVGPLCLGGELRLAHQIGGDRERAAPGLPAPAESDLQGLLLAELPVALGRPVVVLAVGAGLGRRYDGQTSKIGVRQELRATVALPLWSRLAAEAGVIAGLGPHRTEEGRPERWVSTGQLRFGLGLRWGLP